MAYRQPAFMVGNAVEEAGISAIDDNGSTLTNEEKRRFIDFRADEIGTPDARIDVDFGSTGPSETINRCVIPAGHNISGIDQRIFADPTFAPTTKVSGNPDVTATSATIDLDCSDANGDERYWRWIPVSASAPIELGEFWLGEYVQLSADALPDPSFDRAWNAPRVVQEFHTRREVLKLGPARRIFSLTVRNLDPTGSDFAIVDRVASEGIFDPFWYWPPDDNDAGPYLVQLEREASIEQEFAAPSVSILYRVDLRIIEVTA